VTQGWRTGRLVLDGLGEEGLKGWVHGGYRECEVSGNLVP